jgi:hypothetical protein
MRILKILKINFLTLLLLLLMSFSITLYSPEPKKVSKINRMDLMQKAPPYLQVYYYAKKYTKNSNIPLQIFLKTARMETGYKGMRHKKYNPYKPSQVSTANAVGVWQLRVVAARDVWKDQVEHLSDKQLRRMLRYSIKFNAETSIKYLELLYKRYNGDLALTLAAYNRGMGKVKTHADVNDYARKIVFSGIRNI